MVLKSNKMIGVSTETFERLHQLGASLGKMKVTYNEVIELLLNHYEKKEQ